MQITSSTKISLQIFKAVFVQKNFSNDKKTKNVKKSNILQNQNDLELTSLIK